MGRPVALAGVMAALVVAATAGAAEVRGARGGGGRRIVACWDFEEGSGAVVKDRAGGDNNGKLQGSPAAVRFGGKDGRRWLGMTAGGQEVAGPDKGFPTGARAGTIRLWFNRPRGVADKVLFVYGATTRGQARGLWLVKENRLCFYFWGDPRDLHVSIKGGIPAGRWHHVAGTYDGKTARLYYDGALVGQVDHKINTALGGTFHIGRNLVQDRRDFLGLIDDVAVYERALSAEEIRREYDSGIKILRGRGGDDIRAYYAKLAEVEKAARAGLGARTEQLGTKEIIFAVRKTDPDGHWYANFGYNVIDLNRKYYYDGGRLCRLNLRTGRLTVLLDDPTGGVRDPQVHYDAKKILFSYRKGGQPYYHLYEINADPNGAGGSGLRQLTDGPYDDIEPTYLPDGGIAFVSSRCRSWVPCYFTQVAVLHRCDGDGRNIRRLSANVEHENTPWVLPDGRILYQRWEYVDRSQVGYHHLWTMNPDGTGQMVYFGNLHPSTVMIDAKPIPGTRRVVASFSPGHGRNEHSGVITVVDPRAGPDERGFARAISKGHYRDPYPLREDLFLVADATGRGARSAAGTRILLMDGRGRTWPLYQLSSRDIQAGLKVHEPRPLLPRPRETVLPSRVDPSQPTGTAFLENVYVGRKMNGVRRGEIKELLVLEVLPKPYNIFSGMEPLSYGGTFLLQRIVGTVPVEEDGSAHFELPAMRALWFVALDQDGLAVKRMQSFMTVQPGESVGCVGCHDSRVQAPRSRRALSAMRRGPGRIRPVGDVPDVLDFPRDIQPVLDRHCVGCHDYKPTPRGGPAAGGIILCGDRGPMFSHSYYMLTISAQFSAGRNLRSSNYPPRALGSSASPIMKYLSGHHHDVRASERERKLVRLWIDTGAAYPGTYAAMGTGSIGDYRRGRIDRSDLKWPNVQAARGPLRRRCASCHAGRLRLPDSPSDNKGLVPWGEGPMNAVAGRQSQRNNPVFRFNRHIVYNLSRPECSLLLLAPLAKRAGGYGTCMSKGHKGAKPAAVFLSRDDPDYQKILAAVREAADRLDRIKRFDMPGFRPNVHYIREMKRFGILPAGLGPGDAIDVYAADRAYWRSFWYEPPSRPN